jgi:hypothetical protein
MTLKDNQVFNTASAF